MKDTDAGSWSSFPRCLEDEMSIQLSLKIDMIEKKASEFQNLVKAKLVMVSFEFCIN